VTITLCTETEAFLRAYAAVRGQPCDDIFANNVLAASLYELLPRAERVAAMREAERKASEPQHG